MEATEAVTDDLPLQLLCGCFYYFSILLQVSISIIIISLLLISGEDGDLAAHQCLDP